jgi:hypothetical protein
VKVVIKQFDVKMEVKSKGIEFEVRTPDDSSQLGDCYLTMTGLVWCKGRTSKQHGIKISWSDFMEILKSDAARAAAVEAAHAV